MAQQTINIGTLDDDGTGDPLKTAGGKINDNFDEVYLTNVVHINSASDFPAATAGVRELVPTPGDKITYLIAADEIDMGSDKFTVTDGDIVIRGANRVASMITTTATGNMFECEDSGFFTEFIGLDCVNANCIDFSVPVAAGKSLVLDNTIIRDCDTIATIDGAFTTSFRTTTVITTQTGGVTWSGITNNQINISNFLGLDWTGTLLDLGTATFSIVNIGGGNRFISPSGTTIMSGATASANLTATGRGIVDNNLFNGSGTILSGIDTEDLKWDFENNIFADNSTKNTEVVTDAFLTASTTTTIGSIGVYVAVGGSNWSTDINKRFTVSTAGLVTYIGLETIDVAITSNSTVSKVGGGSDIICSKIAINGTVSDKTIGCTQNADPTGIVSNGLFELETNDTIQLFVGNTDSTSNIVVDTSNMIISKR